MIAFICYFFPAVASVFIYEKLQKQDVNRKQWIYLFAWNAMLINLGCLAVKTIVLGSGERHLVEAFQDMLPESAMKYLILAIGLAVTVAICEVLLKKNLEFSVEDVNDAANSK